MAHCQGYEVSADAPDAAADADQYDLFYHSRNCYSDYVCLTDYTFVKKSDFETRINISNLQDLKT